MEKMSVEDIISEIPTEDLLHVGTIKDRIFMPASFAQKWILPTIKVQKALKLHADKNLPGGVETTMLFAIFDQSVMNLNKPISDNLADNAALRAMVTHTKDDKGLISALQKLKQVAKFPDDQTLFRMNSLDIESQNTEY
jgi:hypothetical protein